MGWIWLSVSLGQYRHASSHAVAYWQEGELLDVQKEGTVWQKAYIFGVIRNFWLSIGTVYKKCLFILGQLKMAKFSEVDSHVLSENYASQAGHPQIPSCF